MSRGGYQKNHPGFVGEANGFWKGDALEWRDISDYPYYSISNQGDAKITK